MREKKEERQQSLTNLIHLLFYFEKIFESEPDSLDNRQRGTERERQREKKRDRERGRETEKVRVRGTNRKRDIIKEFGLENFYISKSLYDFEYLFHSKEINKHVIMLHSMFRYITIIFISILMIMV